MKILIQILVLVLGWALLESIMITIPFVVFMVAFPLYLIACFMLGYHSANITEWILEKLHV